jgi:putative protein-disulfide isomerase
MDTTVTYLFDPLCGWCYGASAAVQRLGQSQDFRFELAPTGLFAGRGAHALDAEFAAYAWSNDQRIQKLTGQRFTEAYRSQVLGGTGRRFDSTATTLALSAVALTAPGQELDTLKQLQEARYVAGLDTAEVAVVVALLHDQGLGDAAQRLSALDAELLATHTARTSKAQALMSAVGGQGVPALVVSRSNTRRLLRGGALHGSFEQLLAQVQAV